MSKKNILLLIVAVVVVAVFAFIVVSNKAPQQQQKQVNLNQGKEVDISDWQTYRNEEYGFEVKYPQNWYWEDYTEDFKHLTIGFYRPNNKRGWEYFGDIVIAALENKNNESIEEFYERGTKTKFEQTDKLMKIENKNNQEIIVVYEELGFFSLDSAKLICNGNIVIIDSFSDTLREYFEEIVDSILCF